MRPDDTIELPARQPLRGRSERARILRNAQHRLDQLGAGSLPFELKIEAMYDVLLQAGFDLDRLARRVELARLSDPRERVLA